MRREIIQRNIWRQGGCYVCGVRFNEQTVRGMDAVIVMCFFYMMVSEASNYHEYRRRGGCIKPFGLFWIGNFTSVVMARIFHYLYKFSRYQWALLLIESDNSRITRARSRAQTMMVGKQSAYCAFVVFTILGCKWFVQDGGCLNVMDRQSNKSYRSYRRMAFYLITCLTVCFVFTVKLLAKLIFKITTNREQELVDENRRVNLLPMADQFGRQSSRSLTQRELDLFKKSELRSYDELSRSNKEPSMLSQQTLLEMTTLSTIEPIPGNEDAIGVSIYPDLKQDEIEPRQATCVVCLEDIEIGEWYKRLPNCEHCFHATCIDQWLLKRATCPICREEIFLDERTLERQGNNQRNPV